MPERLEREVLQKARYINTLTFTFTFIRIRKNSRISAKIYPRFHIRAPLVVQSRILHPCVLAPRFPVSLFPFSRFQRPLFVPPPGGLKLDEQGVLYCIISTAIQLSKHANSVPANLIYIIRKFTSENSEASTYQTS